MNSFLTKEALEKQYYGRTVEASINGNKIVVTINSWYMSGQRYLPAAKVEFNDERYMLFFEMYLVSNKILFSGEDKTMPYGSDEQIQYIDLADGDFQQAQIVTKTNNIPYAKLHAVIVTRVFDASSDEGNNTSVMFTNVTPTFGNIMIAGDTEWLDVHQEAAMDFIDSHDEHLFNELDVDFMDTVISVRNVISFE